MGRLPLLLLAKFSYLRPLTASTNLECQDSWKVQHISWLYNAVSDIFSLILSQSWVEFKRNFSKRYFSLVNFKVFKNSKVLKGWILKTVCKLNLPWEEGWWDSFEDIKTFTAFLAPSPAFHSPYSNILYFTQNYSEDIQDNLWWSIMWNQFQPAQESILDY